MRLEYKIFEISIAVDDKDLETELEKLHVHGGWEVIALLGKRTDLKRTGFEANCVNDILYKFLLKRRDKNG